METAITGLIVIGVMILAITGISNSALSAQATVSEATRIAQERVGERVRTQIAPTNVTADANGESVAVTVKNVGITRLADFYNWDVIVEYGDGMTEQVHWMPYGMDANQWSAQIFQDAATQSPETFDPNLLNPGEELLITVNVSPAIAEGSTNRITVVTPNGIVAEATFSH